MNMSDTQRLDAWATAIRALRAHPWRAALFGWGPETFRSAYRLYRTQGSADLIGAMRVADHAHSLPLELLVTLGAVGTAAFAYFAWRLWQEADREGRAALLGLAVMSMVEPVFFPPAAMLALLLGARRYGMFGHWTWPRAATLSVAAALALLSAGVWVDDFSGFTGRSLVLHPHESEANQLALAGALQRGQLDQAVFYGQQAAKADPRYRELVAQAAQFEAAVRARRGR